jgi:protocatechuate 3,4-dioxygenase beta subunit
VGALVALLAGSGIATVAPASATGFTISGTVRSQAAAPVGGVCVDVRDSVTGVQVHQGLSQNDGTYAVSGLPAGSYRVFFDPQCQSLSIPYTWQWWPGTTDPNSAGTITVQSDVPVIDAALAPGGSLSGTLTDPHGQPASGVCVTVTDPSRQYTLRPTRTTTSDVSGHYSFDGLATAAYQLGYGGGCDSIWSSEYYPGVDGVARQLVGVTAPDDTTGVDATVARLTTLSGRLTSTTDATPVAGTCVQASSVSTGSVTGGFYNVTTASDGTYTIPKVARGRYQITFGATPCNPAVDNSPDVALTYYSATGDRTTWTRVSVNGDPVDGVDMALPPGGDLTGRVTGPDGQPLFNIEVRAYATYATGDAARYSYWDTHTDGAGNYTIAGLPTLSGLRVQFIDQYGYRFPDYWYDDKTTIYDATPVDVSAGHVTSGIDAQLHNGSELEGHVLDAAGQPVAGATVHLLTASQPSGTYPPTATTDSSGAWHADGLIAGTYRIWAESPSRSDVAARYLPSASDPAQATPISLAANEILGGQDVHLGAAGHIAGTVTDSSGAPMADVCVTARDPRRQVFVGTTGAATSDANGRYDVGGLNPGSYAVRLTPCPGVLAGSMYHGGAMVQSAATRVDVASGATTDVGVDQLPDGGDIAGTVTTSGTALPSYVTAESDTGERRTVHAASDGSYRIAGLRAGNWRVHFQACPSAQSMYYDGSDTAAGATPVAVGAGEVTSGISADLPALTGPAAGSCPAGPAPVSVVATPIDRTTVLLRWARPPDAPRALTGYLVADNPASGFFATTFLPADDTETLFTGLAPGRYTFTVYGAYWGGSGLSASSQPVALDDTTPPTVSLAMAGLTVSSRASMSWQGHDPNGVRDYDLQWTRRPVGGMDAAWSAFPGGTGTSATRTTFSVTPGYVYCVRVRARDVLGNVSNWSRPGCTMHPADDTAMHKSAGWTASHPSAAYLHTVDATELAGATMTLSVRHVTALYLLTHLCPSCGTVDIYVGSVRVARLSLASSVARWAAVRVPLGASRTGLVTVRTIDRHLVDVDGLGALDG